jgi:transcriptional regulator with XRE-family HTH domain
MTVAVFVSLGAQIRRRRKACGWSQDHLAARAGVDRTTASRWERDLSEPSPASIRTLLRLGILDRDTLSELLAVGSTAAARYKWGLSIIAPRLLLNAACRFGLLHVCNGRETGSAKAYINRVVDLEPFGDRGELRAFVSSNQNSGFTFKCFVECAGLSLKAVSNELRKRGFLEPTPGEGKVRRVWFLLEGYDIVGEHRNNYYFPE